MENLWMQDTLRPSATPHPSTPPDDSEDLE
jgi:hypothetical protein